MPTFSFYVQKNHALKDRRSGQYVKYLHEGEQTNLPPQKENIMKTRLERYARAQISFTLKIPDENDGRF